ncbi:hypothetical protein ABFS83_12G003300 [Erythranthe nasuta]
MANHSPPPSHSSTLILLLLLAITSLSAFASAADSVDSTTTFKEHETMLESLRNHGHTLFTNAIATSDLQYQLLPTASATASEEGEDPTSPFTLFAPLDNLLYALDMASDAATYVNTLRYHIVPNRRYTYGDLQNLTSPFLETLLPNYSVLIGKTQERAVNATVSGVMVDGVRVSNPDLYLGSRVAVHGIYGILLTGLNMNQDLGGHVNSSSSGIFAPVESPAPLPGSDSNSPSEGNLLPPMSHFAWNHAPAAAPPIDENIPVAAPPSYIENIPAAAPPSIENIPVAAPPSYIKNIPVAAPPSYIENIPVAAPPSYIENIPVAAPSHVENIPVAAPPYFENIPVTAPTYIENNPVAAPSFSENIPAPVTPLPKILKDKPEKSRNLLKKKKHKKQGKRQQKSHGHHQKKKHGGHRHCHLEDL